MTEPSKEHRQFLYEEQAKLGITEEDFSEWFGLGLKEWLDEDEDESDETN